MLRRLGAFGGEIGNQPLTASGDMVGGNCNTTVSPAGSASTPAGITNNRSSSAKARDRAGITRYLS